MSLWHSFRLPLSAVPNTMRMPALQLTLGVRKLYPVAAFVRSIHPPVRVALSVSRGRSHAVAPAHPARRADGGAPTSTRTSGRSVVLGVGSSWRSARIRSIWAGQTARPLPPRDMLIRDIIARMRHAAAADRVDRQDASKHVSDRFCHVSRHFGTSRWLSC